MKSNKLLYGFLLRCLGLYILWNVAYYGYIQQHTDLEMWITSKTAQVSTSVLNLFSDQHFSYMDMPKEKPSDESASFVYMDFKPLLTIADSCNALTLIILFAGFIIAYPGKWYFKVPFIAVGSLAVFLINVFRVQVLIFNFIYYRAWFDFNHKYTFTIAVYLCVFYCWMLWANKFSKKSMKVAKISTS